MRMLAVVPPAPATRPTPTPRNRGMGPMSLFLIATVLFMVTSLFYLWEQGQIEAEQVHLSQLQSVLNDLQSTNQQLTLEAQQYTSIIRIQHDATALYHMVPAADSSMAWLPATLSIAPAAAPQAVQPAEAGALPIHDSTLRAWWNTGWAAIARLFR